MTWVSDLSSKLLKWCVCVCWPEFNKSEWWWSCSQAWRPVDGNCLSVLLSWISHSCSVFLMAEEGRGCVEDVYCPRWCCVPSWWPWHGKCPVVRWGLLKQMRWTVHFYTCRSCWDAVMPNFLSLLRKYSCCWDVLMSWCVMKPGEIVWDVNAKEFEGFHPLYLYLCVVVCAGPPSSLGEKSSPWACLH